MYWPYIIPLIVVCSLTATGSKRMMRTAAAIFLNWVAATLFVTITGIYDPWYFYMGVDFAAAVALLHQPAGKFQGLIGATYMGQILLHVIYAFSNHSVGAYPYWQMLTAIAFVQLLLLGGWIVYDRGCRLGWFANPRRAFGNGAASTVDR